MLVVVVLVLMVAMVAVDEVEVATVRQGLVPTVRAMNVHMASVRRVDVNLAIRVVLPRLVVDGRSLGGGVRLSVHDFIICLRAREGQVVEDFAV